MICIVGRVLYTPHGDCQLQKSQFRCILLHGLQLIQDFYLEVIDYQLFAVNTVEKWIGSYLWIYGK